MSYPLLRLALLALTVAAGNTGAQDLEGRWIIDPPRRVGARDSIQLRLEQDSPRGGYSNWGRLLPLTALQGLTREQMSGDGAPVRFRVLRDAGTFEMEGWFRDGRGSGHFKFAPSAHFPVELQRRGYERPTADEQMKLALADAGFDLVDALRQHEHIRPSTTELVRLSQHGVNAKYVREMGALGYKQGYPEQLRRLRDHGVTPEYVRAMTAAGYKGLNWDELQRTRDHGVDAEFIKDMREVGLTNASLAELVKLRDHGVTRDYILEMRKEFPGASIDELRRARDHGVTPGFVARLKTSGYANLTLDRTIRIRDRGGEPDGGM